MTELYYMICVMQYGVLVLEIVSLRAGNPQIISQHSERSVVALLKSTHLFIGHKVIVIN